VSKSKWLVAIAALGAIASSAFIASHTRRVGPQRDGSFVIPTGQTLTPVGLQIETSDRPLGMALSPDASVIAVATASNFASRSIHLLELKTGRIFQTLSIGDSFVGVAFSPDGTALYVGGGHDHEVKFFRRNSLGLFAADGALPLTATAPSGLSVSPDGARLYVALNLRHALGIIDVATRQVREVPVGIYPYTAAVAPDGAKVYVSNWGGRRARAGDATDGVAPVVVDASTGIVNNGTVSVVDAASGKILANIEVGLHPSAMAVSPDGQYLYVANANSDTISVIETASERMVRTLDLRPFAGAPLGSVPNALAIAADGRTLYAANGGNNAIAVLDLQDARQPLRGFIPTGWFPSAVLVTADNQKLIVASGYGFGSVAPVPIDQGRSYANRRGAVSILEVPDPAQLAKYTEQVFRNNHASAIEAAVPRNKSQGSPIQHVFYIIKENRTYDQVLGDLPQGEGDPRLVQFGRNVTPNHHALVERYVLFDNYYSAGDQSALGHQWCDEAYANDYVHKYGNARNNFAGTNPMAYAPSGFLWDHARAFGRTVRVYGEFGSTTITPGGASWSAIYNDWKMGTGVYRFSTRSRVPGLRDVLAPRFPAFEMRITEQVRADVFIDELRAFQKTGDLPNLVMMLLPVDHTQGTAPGYPTPRAMVADNDLALGRIVEAISKSSYWPRSAIFVTEDDAQDGLDHIDGHRTVGMIISPYARRGAVESTLYTQINLFRTIEQILGLPPMNQFDLGAQPMLTAFTDQPDFSPYTALPNQIPIDEMNPSLKGLKGVQRRLAEASLEMDFSKPDAAPEEVLNRAIWHSVKGNQPYPETPERQRAAPQKD
jgi:YVTN family beta-propeller protein